MRSAYIPSANYRGNLIPEPEGERDNYRETD
jgi:hypothetical protein